MELRQLEYLIAVAEEGSFTGAATRLKVAQPGVSTQIRNLERELGQELFDRSGRKVRLTEVGEAVLSRARTVLHTVADARQVVDEHTGLLRGRVAVGMVTACSSAPLFDLLAAFHAEHPAVELSLSEAGSEALLDGVLAGKYDLALVGMSGPPPDGLASLVVVHEAVVAVVRPDHALAARAHLPVAELAALPLICLPRGSGLRGVLDRAADEAGFHPQVAFEASSPEVLAQLAARGLGVALVPASVARAHPELHALTLTKPGLRGNVELVWRAAGPHSPAARALRIRAKAALRRK
jgi:DNA-binding transcriptional LysR family regulator